MFDNTNKHTLKWAKEQIQSRITPRTDSHMLDARNRGLQIALDYLDEVEVLEVIELKWKIEMIHKGEMASKEERVHKEEMTHKKETENKPEALRKDWIKEQLRYEDECDFYYLGSDGLRYRIVPKQDKTYRAKLKLIGYGIASYLRTQSSDSDERMKNLEIGNYYIAWDYRHLSEFTQEELESVGIWNNDTWEVGEVKERVKSTENNTQSKLTMKKRDYPIKKNGSRRPSSLRAKCNSLLIDVFAYGTMVLGGLLFIAIVTLFLLLVVLGVVNVLGLLVT